MILTTRFLARDYCMGRASEVSIVSNHLLTLPYMQ
jgi:hypothetical protein